MGLILAAGNQTRWNYKEYPGLPKIKQLVEVEGQILIERIQEQFPDSIVVTHDKEISKHSKMVFKPAKHGCTIETLFNTHTLWKGWVTILLGDVDYGQRTINLLEDQKEMLRFYGDRGEIYAVKWHEDVTPLIHYDINRLISHEDWVPKFGKLWNLYRVMCGFDYRKEHKMKKYFTFVNDCMDFDTQEQYLKYAKNKRVRK